VSTLVKKYALAFMLLDYCKKQVLW